MRKPPKITDDACETCGGLGVEPEKIWDEASTETGRLERHTVVSFSTNAPDCRTCHGTGKRSAVQAGEAEGET